MGLRGCCLSSYLFLLTQSIIARAAPRNSKGVTFFTYFEMGTTSRMSKPTRGLWFNCFTKPLSTTYLKKPIQRGKKQSSAGNWHTDLILKNMFNLPRAWLFSRFYFKIGSKILVTSKTIIILRVFLLHTQNKRAIVAE